MKHLLILLLILSCSHSRRDGLPTEVLLKVTINGAAFEHEFNLKYQDGLAYLTSQEIEAALGVKSARNSWSYIDKKVVSIEAPENPKLISFSSFKGSEERKITNYVIGFADANLWRQSTFHFIDTNFNLLTRFDSKISHVEAKASVFKIWNAYVNKFGPATDLITLVELASAPLSGGPLGENVLALYSQAHVSPADQLQIQRDLGWTPKASTADYVSAYYGPSGWKTYLTGTLAHELAHTFFGFGLTREKVSSPSELWFSLGLGMVYDVEVTRALTGREPQMFLDSERIWKSFSTNSEIDQRLVNPDTTNDLRFGLDRKKIFAHSKAHAFLRSLRTLVGRGVFDRSVKKYLLSCGDCVNGYRDFKTYIPVSPDKLKKLESEFGL